MVNKNLLRAKMAEYGENQKTLSKALKLSNSALSNRINEKTCTFRANEIEEIIIRYELKSDEIAAIFFDRQVS
jgi:hypothetical protein